MKKTWIRWAVEALLVILILGGYAMREKTVKAAQDAFGNSGCVSYVPRSWGEYKGGSKQAGLAFQDSAGTLRFVTNLPCESTPFVALEIRRTADKQQ